MPGETGAISIATVQGDGATSAIVDREVTVAGVVTGDFQNGDADPVADLGGFFVQSATGDGNPRTSDAVFIVDQGIGVEVQTGDIVEVTGIVAEVDDETRINAATVRVTGTGGSIVPADLPLPADGADLEAREGMLVTLPTMTVIDAFNLERHGTLTLSAIGRISQFTNGETPDRAGFAAHADRVARATLVLDDGSRTENVSPPRYLIADAGDAGRSLRLGDTLEDVTGVLHHGRASEESGAATWRLMPVEEPVFVAANPRPAPPAVGGTLRVMSFNALNYFATLDTGAAVCGPGADMNCRGADSPAEFSRQRDRLVAAVAASGAHVVGLMELHNDANESISSIVAGLNTVTGQGNWTWVDTGVIGDDAIRVGLIFDTRVAESVGEFAVLDASVDPRFDDTRNRPALAQTFAAAGGGRVTVAVNHLKSKGPGCDAVGDPDTGDGQGNCNLTRTRAAAALGDWLDSDPTGSGDSDVLIIGDLNAHLMEDPLSALKDAGYTNLLETHVDGDSYSFVFRGEIGALDHALVSPSLLPQVTGVVEWHINADEPRVLDYNLDAGRDPALFDGAVPYRASDHDPIIVGLDLSAE